MAGCSVAARADHSADLKELRKVVQWASMKAESMAASMDVRSVVHWADRKVSPTAVRWAGDWVAWRDRTMVVSSEQRWADLMAESTVAATAGWKASQMAVRRAA
jgi:hypothetical protein